MWPWSRINSLKAQLADAIREADVWEGKHRLLKAANLGFQQQNAELRKKIVDTGALRGELAEAKGNATFHEDRYNAMRTAFNERGETINDLKAQLAEASKNDKRDARGRFTKAVG